MTKTLDEGRKAVEIAILRDENDALLAARCRYQRVVEQRGVFVEQLPSFPRGDSRQSAAALDEGSRGRRENAPTPFEWVEYSSLQFTSRFGRPRAGSELLHHDCA